MGRASRKKNRLRGNSGGIYSKLFTPDLQKIKTIHNTYRNFDKGIALENIHGKMNNLTEYHKVILTQAFKSGITDHNDLARMNTELISRYVKYKNYYHHYFITDEDLVLFLENQKIKSDAFTHLPDIVSEYCPLKSIKGFTYDFYAGIIHIINRQHSIFFSLSKCFDIKTMKDSNYYMLYLERGDGEGDEDSANINLLPESAEEYLNLVKNKPVAVATRIIFNMFLYLDAFPEAIKTGPPPIKNIDYLGALSNTTLGETDAIKGLFDKHHVSPHMRRGHYRFLQSDRYKKKRFQTVFVRPTMVKGTASHIIDVEKELSA